MITMAKEKENETTFDITERVTVYSTDKDPHHTTGDPMNVGVLVAKKLIKNGMATEQPPKSSTSKTDK